MLIFFMYATRSTFLTHRMLLDLILTIMLSEQKVKILFITYISPTSCNSRPFRSKHSCRHRVFEHLQSSLTGKTEFHTYTR